MNRSKLLYKVLVGIPAVIVCILFGCQKKDALVPVSLPKQQSTTGMQDLMEPKSPMEQLKELEAEGTEDLPVTDEQPDRGDLPEDGQNLSEEAASVCEPLVVHICGAVANPGVYELQKDDRLYHAVEMAGGFLETADREYLNQAQKLTDGMQITIPTVEQAEKARQAKNGTGQFIKMQGDLPDDSTDAQAVGLINLNTATEEALCSLPGIGSERAKSIIAYRNQNGGYKRIEEIMNVTGIKEGMFVKLKDRITVG